MRIGWHVRQGSTVTVQPNSDVTAKGKKELKSTKRRMEKVKKKGFFFSLEKTGKKGFTAYIFLRNETVINYRNAYT